MLDGNDRRIAFAFEKTFKRASKSSFDFFSQLGALLRQSLQL